MLAFNLRRSLCVARTALLVLAALPGLPAAAADNGNTMRLASLEWLPYVGPGLEQEGLSAVIARNAARQFGYSVQIDYFPWKRTMQVGGSDPRYDGYFPAYYTEERAQRCHFSAAMGTSTLGFAYLKNQPLQWRTLHDLVGQRIGVVAGYSNSAQFDALAREGTLTVDSSPSDILNLRKLLAGRVDIIVIDRLVMRYLLLTDPALSKEQQRFDFHERPLADLSLHVCFHRTPQGKRQQQAFDAALQSVQVGKLEAEYFQRIEHRKAAPSK